MILAQDTPIILLDEPVTYMDLNISGVAQDNHRFEGII